MEDRKAVTGITLTLLLIGALGLVFDVGLVGAGGTIYIRADGSIDPPTAPIQSNVVNALSEAPTIEWNKTYGGANHDEAYSVVQTDDQGYIVVGYTRDTDTGQADGWLIKTDANGNMEWNKTYGGNFDDEGVAIQQTSDGGYIVTGYSCFIGDPYYTYGADLWLFKTDANGNTEWNKTYGQEYSEEYGFSVQQTSDGGYIVVGRTDYFSDDDLWLIKTDANGNYQWDRWYIRDNGRDEAGFTIQQTSDGGYIMVGCTCSVGTIYPDAWLVKTDANGDMEWNKIYGGPGFDLCEDLESTSDGGYVLVGRTDSFGAGRSDFWLIKVDSSGNMAWNKTYGGTMYDGAYSVVKTSDGGYALAGTTQSFGAAYDDFWLVKTDVNGDMEWNKTYGGAYPDYGHTVEQTSDGGYIVAGSTSSFGAGYLDAWLIKLAPPTHIHDIAVTNVVPSKTVVGQGYSLNINVTAANQGDYAETFNVTVYANTTSIATQTVTLESGDSTTITFTWNTSGFAKGNYTISAYAQPVSGETDTADNTFIDGIVVVAVVVAIPDVAVTNITASPTKIPRGNPVYITVTVENQGGFPESFTVYVYADGRHPPYGDEYVLPPQTVSNLLSGEVKTLDFTWDTTGVSPGSYTISAYIPPITGETDTGDNFLKGPIVGGVFEPDRRTPSKWILDLSIPFVIFDLIIAGIAAIGVFKILMSDKPLKSWRLTKRTR